METVDILGTAWSVDGRTFSAQVTRNSLQAGLVISLGTGEEDYLGLVLSVDGDAELDRVLGVVMGTFDNQGWLAPARRGPFPHAQARPLRPEQVSGLQDSTAATLDIGRWDMAGTRAQLKLLPKGFNRHTFLCGQSGSGKTYALGVILEQLILHTRLPMIVLDPNGDFVHLAEARADAPGGLAVQLAEAGIEVTGTAEKPQVVRFVDLSQAVQAAVLKLDPVRDREESFHEFANELGNSGSSGRT